MNGSLMVRVPVETRNSWDAPYCLEKWHIVRVRAAALQEHRLMEDF